MSFHRNKMMHSGMAAIVAILFITSLLSCSHNTNNASVSSAGNVDLPLTAYVGDIAFCYPNTLEKTSTFESAPFSNNNRSYIVSSSSLFDNEKNVILIVEEYKGIAFDEVPSFFDITGETQNANIISRQISETHIANRRAISVQVEGSSPQGVTVSIALYIDATKDSVVAITMSCPKERSEYYIEVFHAIANSVSIDQEQ